ncbi:helix-turn-helix transcriptional regulator [Streptomyces stramineus]|uniref:helix-turn-helix domain-containing protein n=1 Tax=Streptomyces stramineus TaxID=173861 RepID=UPI0031DF906F
MKCRVFLVEVGSGRDHLFAGVLACAPLPTSAARRPECSQALDGYGLSLRAAAAGSGVNRQAITDLLAGRSWPDVATVARLARFTSTPLWPDSPNIERKRMH